MHPLPFFSIKSFFVLGHVCDTKPHDGTSSSSPPCCLVLLTTYAAWCWTQTPLLSCQTRLFRASWLRSLLHPHFGLAHGGACSQCGATMRAATSTDCYILTSNGLAKAQHSALRCGSRRCPLNGKLVWANFIANEQGCHMDQFYAAS